MTPMIDNPLGGRDVSEWVGSSPNARVPQYVRDRIFMRAKGRCHISGRKITPGEPWDLDHVKPLWKGGEHRESNLRPALAEPHKIKTAEEAGDRSKADRIRRKHLGTWPESKAKIRSRGFQKTRG